MITATDVEISVGSRVLLDAVTFRVAPGDRIGLVGRNGAGKTTLTKVLAGELLPAAGSVTNTGEIGYLPQDPRTGDLDVLARDRILSARGLDVVVRDMRAAETSMGSSDDGGARRRGTQVQPNRRPLPCPGWLRRRVRGRIHRGQPRAARPGARPTARHACRAGSGVGSNSPASCSPAPRRCSSTNRPTTSTPTRSPGCGNSCASHKGGLVLISHDVTLLETTVNRVLHLDATRAVLDVYNVGWKTYLEQREADERRRKRERANAERKATTLQAQADRMRYKATKATAAQNMEKRAHKLLAGLEEVRKHDRVAKLRFPEPAPCGKVPLSATGLSKSYGSLEVFTDVDLAIDRG